MARMSDEAWSGRVVQLEEEDRDAENEKLYATTDPALSIADDPYCISRATHFVCRFAEIRTETYRSRHPSLVSRSRCEQAATPGFPRKSHPRYVFRSNPKRLDQR